MTFQLLSICSLNIIDRTIFWDCLKETQLTKSLHPHNQAHMLVTGEVRLSRPQAFWTLSPSAQLLQVLGALSGILFTSHNQQ